MMARRDPADKARIAALKQRLPHADFSKLEKDPQIGKVGEIFTVDALVNFVEKKLAAAPAKA